MLVAIDVHYDEVANQAGVAAILFPSWHCSAFKHKLTAVHTGLQPYEPGFFYKREMPCILPVLQTLNPR